MGHGLEPLALFLWAYSLGAVAPVVGREPSWKALIIAGILAGLFSYAL